MVSCLGKPMHCRSNLSLNKRRAKRVICACELRGERFQTIERIKIAEKLRHQILVIDNRLRGAEDARVLREPRPCTTARALQVDRGDLPVGRSRQVRLGEHRHVGTPKRAFRLPRPVSINLDTIVRTAMSGCLLARNSTRHSATEPLAFGLTSMTPA